MLLRQIADPKPCARYSHRGPLLRRSRSYLRPPAPARYHVETVVLPAPFAQANNRSPAVTTSETPLTTRRLHKFCGGARARSGALIAPCPRPGEPDVRKTARAYRVRWWLMLSRRGQYQFFFCCVCCTCCDSDRAGSGRAPHASSCASPSPCALSATTRENVGRPSAQPSCRCGWQAWWSCRKSRRRRRRLRAGTGRLVATRMCRCWHRRRPETGSAPSRP